MMVDISHVADKTFYGKHSGSSYSLSLRQSRPHQCPPQYDDDMIKGLTQKGDVIQVNFYRNFISQKSADAPKDAPVRATLADVVAHIDHIKQIAGVDAIGIGTDFDGIECAPIGLDDVSRFPSPTRALLEKGYSPADIKKIYGGNTFTPHASS